MENDTMQLNNQGEEPTDLTPENEPMSFTDKLIGVITEPGNVFAGVKKLDRKSVV